jgi:hypothetical protein
MRLQRENKVDYVGQIAGWPTGCYRYGNKKLLVTSETPLLTPTYGGSRIIWDFRERLYGREQAAVKHAWTKLAIEARKEGERRIKAGLTPSWPIQQALCIVGAKNHPLWKKLLNTETSRGSMTCQLFAILWWDWLHT